MLIIGNGRVLTRNEEMPFIENGAVAMEGCYIKAVGSTEEMKEQFPQARYIDAKGGVIMPAFINTHEHIYSAMARGLAITGYAPKGFLDILDGLWWNIDRHLTNDLTYLSAQATYIECIKNGVTTIFDHHASFGEIRAACLPLPRPHGNRASGLACVMKFLTATARIRPSRRSAKMRTGSSRPRRTRRIW